MHETGAAEQKSGRSDWVAGAISDPAHQNRAKLEPLPPSMPSNYPTSTWPLVISSLPRRSSSGLPLHPPHLH